MEDKDKGEEGFLVRQGYLQKKPKSKRSVKSWKTRWFVLTDDSLMWFRSVKDKKPRGVLNLKELRIQHFGIMGGKNYIFELVTPKKSHLLCSLGSDEIFEWAKVLKNYIRRSKGLAVESDEFVKPVRVDGVLKMTLNSLEDLQIRSGSVFGLIAYRRQQFRTNTVDIEKSSHFIPMNEEFNIHVWEMPSEVSIILYQKGFRKDDFIGSARVPLGALKNGEEMKMVYPIHPRRLKGSSDRVFLGKVNATMHLTYEEAADGSEETLFGRALEDVMARDDHKGAILPYPLALCAQIIMNYEPKDVGEGLFRLAVEMSLLNDWKRKFAFATSIDVESLPPQPHLVVSLFKGFLRELDPPLVPYDDYFKFLSVDKKGSRKDKIEFLSKMIQSLPIYHRNSAVACFSTLRHVAQPEFVEVTKMGIENLASIFAAIVSRPKIESMESLMMEIPIMQRVLEFVISEWSDIASRLECSETINNLIRGEMSPKASESKEEIEISVGDEKNASCKESLSSMSIKSHDDSDDEISGKSDIKSPKKP